MVMKGQQNNNYGSDPNKCVLFHCGNWAKSFFSDVKMANAEILATTYFRWETYMHGAS
jgi:hypothetical protein